MVPSTGRLVVVLLLVGDEALELEGLGIVDVLGLGRGARMAVHEAGGPLLGLGVEGLARVGRFGRFGPGVDGVDVEEDVDD